MGKSSLQRTKSITSSRSAKYTIGQHGYKKKEQKSLNVNGTTHESEHVIGYEPLARGLKSKRGKGSEARSIENSAPAYQEIKEFHRGHIGTGNSSLKKEENLEARGFETANSYRNSQRSLLKTGDKGISSSMQLNQLSYSYNKKFREESSKELKSDKSFNTMVSHFSTLKYVESESVIKSITISDNTRLELYFARQMARGKMTLREITDYDIKKAKKLIGIG